MSRQDASLSLIDLIDFLRRMYGLRNCIYHNSSRDVLDMLDYGLHDLDQVVAGKTNRSYATSFASLFAVTVAFLDTLSRAEMSTGKTVGQHLVEVLSKKYPGTCLYCNQSKCMCPETKRPKPNWRDRESIPDRLGWSLGRWQRAWKETYGEKNEARSFEANVANLASEAREIRRVRVVFAQSTMPSHLVLDNYIEEVADFIARLCALASLERLKIDVGDAVWKRYGSGCPKCHKFVCRCQVHHSNLRAYFDPTTPNQGAFTSPR